MSVLVRNMAMPKSCSRCEFEGGGYCFAVCKPILHVGNRTDHRHPHCPLLALPEKHGRLIDANALYGEIVLEGQQSTRYKIGDFWELNALEIRRALSRTPTVFPAEGEESE